MHLAGGRLDGDQRGVGRIARLQIGDVVGRRLFGQVLQVEVEAGGDLQAFAEQRFGAELLVDQLAHVRDEVGRLLGAGLAGGSERDGCARRRPLARQR